MKIKIILCTLCFSLCGLPFLTNAKTVEEIVNTAVERVRDMKL